MTYQSYITQKYCTCTDEDYNPTYIGHLQKEYEIMRNKDMTFMEAMDALKIKRICCRDTLFNPPQIFLNDECSSRMVDKVGLGEKKTKNMTEKVLNNKQNLRRFDFKMPFVFNLRKL
jgi:DNA-directed RNA polymerase subunit N (RpoN/RPB10)